MKEIQYFVTLILRWHWSKDLQQCWTFPS